MAALGTIGCWAQRFAALAVTWGVAALLFVGVDRRFLLRILPVAVRRAALAG